MTAERDESQEMPETGGAEAADAEPIEVEPADGESGAAWAEPDDELTDESDDETGDDFDDWAEPDEPLDLESEPDEDEAPSAGEIGRLLTDVIEAGSSIFERLKTIPADKFAGLSADPIAAGVQLGQRVGVDWGASLEDTISFARSRLAGDYAVDQFGFDPEFTERLYLPVVRWVANNWFRVEVRGAENLPDTGSALLVSNHAGAMPLDGLVLHSVVHDAIGRHTRMLGADLIFTTPFSHDFARRIGTTVACREDAARLLESDQLVSVFPEGFKGLGKLYSERYRLKRFGRGGFVATAIEAQVPIVPVSIVGSEEIFPLVANLPSLAKALGFPYFPVTPLFPWFGVLGMIPLPSKWIIDFSEPVPTDQLAPGAADDPMTVFGITDQVRITIQNRLHTLLEDRPNPFF